jgi:hypothetical protein
MDPEEIAAFDRAHVHPTAPSLNFVTNMVGCMIVGEAVKLITGKGRCARYPDYLTFDLFDLKMKRRNSNSPLNPENLRRLSCEVKHKLAGSVRFGAGQLSTGPGSVKNDGSR